MARTIAKDYDQKRQSILTIAAEVFAREGIARASMNKVAQSCGISKANIYHYYDGKDALLFDILDTYLSALSERVGAVNLAGKPNDEQLRALVHEYLLAYEGMDHEHKIQTEGLPLLPNDLQDVLKGYQRKMVAQMSDVLDRLSHGKLGEEPGKLRDVTMSVFGMLNWYYMWQPKASAEDRAGYAATITNLVKGGLAQVLD